ncbi:phosphonate ABC transporter ATP-binding protein [Roseibium polysiphoniae]|uniref:Phosphonate ABC transporter ATP-binding protein n=1 Tax=Roseibium polysiphoniae TaxID=2571221 RepID=A0ABR9CEC8_9HYPH|nr:phosphonate ABC transporter ATP-binding protein [Roseibium polysiphoniae]MBD8878244.1 phosphonate ABC transporter ATP-binding protein [Roseibium polysiphoniae]
MQTAALTTGAQAPAVPPPSPTSPAKPDLAIRGLCKSFEANRAILTDVSFSIANKEAVALIGSNGAGKSTALRCAMRLIEPDSGEAVLFGTELRSAKARQLRKIRSDVGFVFQKHNLVPRVSALTNVVHGNLGRASGVRGWSQAFSGRQIRERAYACLERVGLSEQAMKRADQLSGGQSQRVAIARALMQQPKMIVADEPVASLDPVAGQEVMDLFHHLAKEEGITLLFTTHNVAHALAYSDRVVALRGGKVELDQTSAVLSSSDLNEFYG